MSRLFYQVMQDNLGNLLFGVSGTMRVGGSGTLATIYGDEALTVILPNPMTNHPSFGSFKCYLGAGSFDFYMAKAGYTFETLTGVPGQGALGTMSEQDADAVAITGGTANLTTLGVTGTGIIGVLGVGTAPTHTLHVGGTTRLGDTGIGTTPQAGNVLSVTGRSVVDGDVGIRTVPAYPLDVTGYVRVGNTGINALPTAANALAVTGRVALDGDVGIHTVPAYPLDVIGMSRLGNVGINALPTAPNALAVTGRIVLDGDVGIHATPAYPLDVVGLSRLGNVGINALPTVGNALTVTGAMVLSGGNIGVHTAPSATAVLKLDYEKGSGVHGMVLGPTGSDTGAFALVFTNIAGTAIGSISTDVSTTAFNTTSDARLKHAIEPLAGALDVVRALNPVSFVWKADGSPGRGLLAQEVQAVIPDGVITGAKDAVDDTGNVQPMQIDYSKLVPWLIGAVKELTQQVEMLTAKLGGSPRIGGNVPTQEDYAHNPYQYNLLDYTTSTEGGDTQAVGYSPRYLTDMLQRQDLVEQGKATPWEHQLQQNQMQAAQRAPMRDPRTLQYNAGEQDATTLSGGSPDLAGLMFGMRQRIQQGTATDQERQLFDETLRGMAEQTYRSVVPQASDAFNPLGDQFFGALGTLALGATGGLAGGALAAGGGLASTLGSLGTLAGTAGTGASVLGQATDQEWLQKLGMGLGAAGGIAGGIGGIANLAGSGVQSLSDAARLASNAGRVVGGVGSIADNDALKQAGGWLGTAGQFGGGVDNLRNLLGGTGGSLQGVMGLLKPLQKIAGQFMQPGGRDEAGQGTPQRPVGAAPQRPMSMAPGAPGAGPSGIQALLQAAGQARQRGGPLTDQDWLRRDWRLRNPAAQSTLYNL